MFCIFILYAFVGVLYTYVPYGDLMIHIDNLSKVTALKQSLANPRDVKVLFKLIDLEKI